MVIGFVALALAALRIVSLVPAITEDLFAIGAGRAVVAVDAYSDRPAAAARLPRIGALREVNAEAILALRPDLVVGLPYQAPVLEALARAGVHTAMLPLDDLSDDLDALDRLGALTGHQRGAREVRRRIEYALDALSARAARFPERTAFVVIGEDPLYTAGPGSYVDDVLRLAHLHNVVPKSGTPWPAYSEERLVVDQPDVLIVADGTSLRGAPWQRLRAVREGHVVTLPTDVLMQPGPEVAVALRMVVTQADRWR